MVKYYKERTLENILLIIRHKGIDYEIRSDNFERKCCSTSAWDDPDLVEITLLELLMEKEVYLKHPCNFVETCATCRFDRTCPTSSYAEEGEKLFSQLKKLLMETKGDENNG